MLAIREPVLRNIEGRPSPGSSWICFVPEACGGFAIALGLLVCFAWYAHWATMLQVFPGLPPMKFNTALAFVSCGAGLLLLKTRPRFAPWLGLAAFLVGTLTLTEYLSGLDFGIDEFFVRSYIGTASAFAGRMSPLAASCFTLFGVALAVAGQGRRSRVGLTAAGLLACIVSMIACISLFGYILGIDVATGWGNYTRLALHTSAAFFVLGIGLLVWSWEAARQIHFNFLRWLPVTASVTLMVMIAIISTVSFVHLSRANFWQRHTYDVIDAAQLLLGNLTDTQRGMRGYILSGQPQALEVYNGAIRDIPDQLDRLRTLTYENPDQQARLMVLRSAVEDVVAYSHRLLAAREKRGIVGTVEIESTGEGLAVMNRARASLRAFTNEEHRLLDERTREVDVDFDNTKRLVILGTALASALLLLANFMASREVEFRRRAEARFQDLAAEQKAILNSANQAIIATTLEGVVTSFNQTAERWLGYSAGEIVGKTTPALWHDPEEVVARAHALSDELGRHIEPGFAVFVSKIGPNKPDETEWTFKRKDGSRFPVLLTATEVADAEGRLVGYLGVITDLTLRKKMETDLEKNRALFNSILRNSLDGVIAYQAIRNEAGAICDFRFTLINPAAEKFSDLSAAKHVGMCFTEVFPALVTEPIFGKFVQIVETGRMLEFEHLSKRTNPPRWYRLGGSKLDDGLAISYTDITERKRAEETLRLSEERFRLIVDGVKDYALFMLDPDGTVASWNAGSERLFGYGAREIIGQHFSSFHSQESVKAGRAENEIRIAAKVGRYEEEGWRVRKDGTMFLANVVTTAIHDDQGRLRGFAKIIRDITEQKKFDKAVRDQAQIMDLANDTIFVRDANDKIVYWNQGAQRVYGWTKEEALGRTTHELFKTKFSQPLAEIMAQLLTQGHWEGELEHLRRDGETLTVLSRWTLQVDETGRPPKIIEMNYDITERKEMERTLHEKNIELENAARAKNSFLANMSHELRTPLNGIIGFSQLLVDGLPGEINAEQKEYLGDILNSSEHLLQLINDVLDLAKVESGKMDMYPETFSLLRAIEQVCSVAYPLIQKKNIKLIKEFETGLDLVTLDQKRFKQILYNLLSNAIKFTDPKGTVELFARMVGSDSFLLGVRDTGIGIKPENIKRLFKEFEQLDEGTTRRYQGTGLGLALTRKLIETQGGKIEVESVFGEGTTFTVTLPFVHEEELP